jgi:hypothetical protein
MRMVSLTTTCDYGFDNAPIAMISPATKSWGLSIKIPVSNTIIPLLKTCPCASLSGAEQDAFESFFFGFTGAAGAEALDVTISQFQLSFIRPGDPVVDCDKLNWPVEAPVPDCLLID